MCLRRSLLTLACVLLWAGQAQAQSVVDFASDVAGDPFLTDGIDAISISIAGGNGACVAFGVAATNRTVSSVVDSSGTNTYAQAATIEANSQESWIWCTVGGAAATSITITLSSGVGGGFIVAWEISGQHATDMVGASASAAVTVACSGACHSTGTLTVEAPSSLLLGYVYGSNGSYTPDADYTPDANNTISAEQIVAAHRSVTANDAMVTSTAGNEVTQNVLIEILPAAAGSTCKGGVLLLGAGKCD